MRDDFFKEYPPIKTDTPYVMVKCPRCKKEWRGFSSRVFCQCGARFDIIQEWKDVETREGVVV